MFEEQYRKLNQEIKPSDALNEETFALMKEAQDHRAAMPPKPLRWKPAVLIPAAGTVAAVLEDTILLAFWMSDRNVNKEAFDAVGNLDEIISDEEEPSQSEGQEQTENQPDTEPEDAESSGTSVDENQSFSGSSAPSDDDGKTSENPTKDPAEPPAEPETDEPDQSMAADPRNPDIINDESTTTYTTIRAFLNALAKKETPGYGTNYYNARDLIIVPSKLPEQTRFRHFHLDNKTGKYSYSYIFTANGKEYFLDIEVDAETPKTLRDLNVQKQLLAEEEILTGKKGNQLFYLFGQNDEVTVTLTEYLSSTALTEDEVATLLAQFELERCSLANYLIDITF